MEKLELKHLAPYLPYGLKLYHVGYKAKHILDTSIKEGVYDREMSAITLTSMVNGSEYLKPILRPLSDLTKEIEHNGERFLPILELAKASDSFYDWEISKQSLFHKSAFCNHYTGELSFSINTDFKKLYSINTTLNGYFIQTNNPHLVYQKLIEWHFDIFGLIEKGLAIDINTINN